MESCYEFVETVIGNLEQNLEKIPEEMRWILAIIMTKEEIYRTCKDPMWLFTDLLVGCWIGPALTSLPLHHGLQPSKFYSQDLSICMLAVCRILLEIAFLGPAVNIDSYLPPMENVKGRLQLTAGAQRFKEFI